MSITLHAADERQPRQVVWWKLLAIVSQSCCTIFRFQFEHCMFETCFNCKTFCRIPFSRLGQHFVPATTSIRSILNSRHHKNPPFGKIRLSARRVASGNREHAKLCTKLTLYKRNWLVNRLSMNDWRWRRFQLKSSEENAIYLHVAQA